MLGDIPALRLQEPAKQNHFKLSYYVPLQANSQAISTLIQQRFEDAGIKSSLIWSVDEPAGVGLLDILPARASKYHAVEALMKMQGFDFGNTVFCGDSGNDIEVLASPVPAVLVANSQPDVRELARLLAREGGCENQLYIAHGDFLGMNGNYSAGMLEGIAHYYPWTQQWMKLEESRN
jgi:hydroxymethylpyrimidine pyrophosphatase-like HAD family hydrolase